MNEMIQTNPINVEKSVRGDEIRSLTSTQGGKIVPLAIVPLLREDRVNKGSIRLSFEMAETIHPLLNAVNVTAHAYFVSPLCFDRFDGMDSLNRSYQGVVEPATGLVIPWVQTMPFAPTDAIWRKLGVQWPTGAAINRSPVEAYNAIVNFRRRSRTDRLPERTALDTTLAECFWKNTDLSHIVPDWDQAAMDGEVELSFADSQVYVQGFGRNSGTVPTVTAGAAHHEILPGGGTTLRTYPFSAEMSHANLGIETNSNGTPLPFVELMNSGVRLSLANIELAKQTASFAKLREKFDGIDDEHIIDLLMEGIRVPEAAMSQPLLLDRKSTVFGYSERHAMDGDNLDKSVTTGKTELTLNFRTPPMNTGGLIMVTCEIVPEQLYERKYDAYLGTHDPAHLPNFMRDYLDPEKVETVLNNYPDVLHDTPAGIFGYAPLNHMWKRSFTRAGGKFYRPDPDSFVEDRQRFWSVDQQNPSLTDDFYMVSDLPHTVFADTISDSFEVLTLGRVGIIGNTVFGDMLDEDTGSYDAIMDQVDTGRITQA